MDQACHTPGLPFGGPATLRCTNLAIATRLQHAQLKHDTNAGVGKTKQTQMAMFLDGADGRDAGPKVNQSIKSVK